jgi:CRISPR-associated protein Cas1
MPRPYFIFSSGTLKRKENTLYLESKSEEHQRKYIPVNDVDEIFIFGEVDINSKLINFLGQNGITVHFFNWHGFFTSSLFPRQRNVSGHLLVKQVQNYLDHKKRMYIATEITRGAIFNIKKNIDYYSSRGRELADILEAVESEMNTIDSASNIPELMGAEGKVRENYYKAFSQILNEFEFDKRVRRPPDNPINALISFGNSLLYTTCLSQIYVTQLNPTISYLHEPSERRYSLALDIAEIFKPIIVDRTIFKLVNKGMLDESDFDEDVNFCYLTEKGRKTFVKEFDERLETTIKHRKLGRNVSYRTLIRMECYKLVKHLLEDELYEAFRAWW